MIQTRNLLSLRMPNMAECNTAAHRILRKNGNTNNKDTVRQKRREMKKSSRCCSIRSIRYEENLQDNAGDHEKMPAGPRRYKTLIHRNCKKINPNDKSHSDLFGGGWWIRTTEGIASRFTVCPLWPLGKSPIPMKFTGAGGRTRTPDLLITNQLLYQLSYTST